MYRIRLIDLKLAGTVKYVPILINLILFLICRFVFPGNRDAWLALELLIPYSSVWAGSFYIAEIIQNQPLAEMLFASNKKMHAVITVKYLMLSFFSLLIGLFVAVGICIPIDLECGRYFLVHLCFECVTFTGLSYLLSVFLRSPGWVITLIMSIIVSDYGTQGKIFKNLHFSLYWYEDLTKDIIFPRIYLMCILSLVFYIIGYWVLKTTKGSGLSVLTDILLKKLKH